MGSQTANTNQKHIFVYRRQYSLNYVYLASLGAQYNIFLCIAIHILVDIEAPRSV